MNGRWNLIVIGWAVVALLMCMAANPPVEFVMGVVFFAPLVFLALVGLSRLITMCGGKR